MCKKQRGAIYYYKKCKRFRRVRGSGSFSGRVFRDYPKLKKIVGKEKSDVKYGIVIRLHRIFLYGQFYLPGMITEGKYREGTVCSGYIKSEHIVIGIDNGDMDEAMWELYAVCNGKIREFRGAVKKWKNEFAKVYLCKYEDRKTKLEQIAYKKGLTLLKF